MWRTIGRGRATTWTIKFNMDKATQGKATLRVALGGADGGGGLAVAVNGKSVGTIRTVATNALRYNTDRGVWHEYAQPFDAALSRRAKTNCNSLCPRGTSPPASVTITCAWNSTRSRTFISSGQNRGARFQRA